MKKLLLLVFLITMGYAGYTLVNRLGLWPNANQKVYKESTLKIGDTIYNIEVADNDAKRSHGLSDRPSLSENHGMLFLFPQKDRYGFWMKGMKFNLDFVWIDGDTIVELKENVPAPLTETYTPPFQPKTAVDKVLEINSGEIKKHGITAGQTVSVTLSDLKP